jgi:hypothetical protein
MKFKLGLAVGAAAGYLVASGKARELLQMARCNSTETRQMSTPLEESETVSMVVVGPGLPSEQPGGAALYS